MTTEQQLRETFDRDGVLHLPGWLEPAEVDQLQTVLDEYIKKTVPTIPRGDAFFEEAGDASTLKQMQRMERHDERFDALRRQDKFVKLAELLLGGGARSQGVEWFNKPPGIGKATPPHQDGYYFCLVPNEAITIWIALDDVSTENGCLRYVRGSHRAGLRPHGTSEVLGFSQTILDFGPEDVANEYVAELKRGDAVVHHSLTIHRAEANTSRRSRRSLGMVFYSERARRDEEAYRRYWQSSSKQQAEMGAID